MQDTGVTNLRIAIIECAIRDYKIWQKALLQRKRPTIIIEKNGRSAEAFFRSSWFQELASLSYPISPEALMEKVRQDAIYELRHWKKNKVTG